MQPKQSDPNKVLIFASLIITIALFFNGYTYLRSSTGAPDGDLQLAIEKGIEDYVQGQQEAVAKAQAEANAPKVVTGDFTDDDAMLGDEAAPVTIVEFSDYECPFCKRHFTQTFSQIKEKYIDTGKVKYVFRDFPLGFHDPLATEEAMAAECVRDQKGDETYFAYHDLIFENTTSNGRGMQKARLYELAEEIGADKAEFADCLDSEKFKSEVQKDISDGAKAGVNGTPAFLINDQFVSGAQPFSNFEQVIEAELNK